MYSKRFFRRSKRKCFALKLHKCHAIKETFTLTAPFLVINLDKTANQNKQNSPENVSFKILMIFSLFSFSLFMLQK